MGRNLTYANVTFKSFSIYLFNIGKGYKCIWILSKVSLGDNSENSSKVTVQMLKCWLKYHKNFK